MLPSGNSCSDSSAIYFKQNVYCFGGYLNNNRLALSARFDLYQNRWVKLIPMPWSDFCCHSVIFKENISIAGCTHKNILLYSIDNESFSIVPYSFALHTRKILISSNRLYLIECCFNGWIYESKIGDEYSWKQIGKSVIKFNPLQVFCTYNKGGVYIASAGVCNDDFYKFSLNKKVITKL
ncbi:unnamed protein product [Blepharisma stoltei]|uniref:Uncharacterized protein n=1 Tax=Blepharisma stoltei TaxID=1481888 RepID=A0AAU9K843_9CILI|nr:unnamed protein product [Blepharisma stoltei]